MESIIEIHNLSSLDHGLNIDNSDIDIVILIKKQTDPLFDYNKI